MNHLLNTRKGVGGAEMEEEPMSEKLRVLIKKKKEEEKKKAIQHWGILKKSIRFTMKALEDADVKDVHISHGMLHLRKLNHDRNLKCVLFMVNKKEYLTTDGQTVRLFLEDGRKKDEYIPEEPMDNIAYCKQTNQFVGWMKDEEEIFLMNPDFEIISQSKVPSKINLAKYNASTNEFITIGPGYIVNWAFRYGARHLIPRKMCRIDYRENNQFKHLVLEETASRQQKCFLSLGNGVVVFNVFEGKQLAKRKDLHEREITALTYFNPLKYLITGAKDGTIKVWDKEWFLKTVFVGHTGRINLLAVYPEGPQIISASMDCSIRVWNLDSCDEADKIVMNTPVANLGSELNYHVLFTYHGKTVDLWRLNHLYHIHTAVGHRVVGIKQTTHPNFPIRAVVVSRDCSVRLICPPNGEVLTTFLLDQADGIVDTTYAIREEMLFTVKRNGDIVKARTDTNPATIVDEWECTNPKEACNCLLIYEYVPEFETNAWAAFKRGLATKTIGQEGAHVSHEKTILLGGRKDGHICVFDWDTGEVTFKIDAHGIKGVLSMIGNSKQDQLISAGLDNIIKVWRLFPFAEEALAPLMSFYCAHTPVYMTMLKTNLCVAFQDHATATYSIVIYNLKDRSELKEENQDYRYDHQPDDDHTDTITGLTSCVRMKLYASSSLDGTIRIWNETNTLTRVLKLKTMPYSIGFCSQKGDLLVGVENHLYKIPYYMYLPRAYRVKMVSMKFADPKVELALPYDEDVLSELSKYDYTRLKQSHSSFTYDHFEDILTKEEEEEVTREQKIKQAAYAELKLREQELLNLRKGAISPRIRPQQTPDTKSEAFDRYMKMYYDKPRLSIPADEPFPKDKVEEYLAGPPEKVTTPFTPEREPTGFFPPKSQSAKSRASSKRSAEAETPVPLEPQYAPINTDGFVPNSVLTKILWPPPPEKKKKEVTWRPPTFTDDQLVKPASPEEEDAEEQEAEDEEPVMIMDWGEKDEDEVSYHESPIPSEKTPSPPPIRSKEVTFDQKPTVHEFDKNKSISPTPPSSKQPSSLMSKFKELQAAKPPSPVPKLVHDDEDDTSTMTATPRSLSDFDQIKSEKTLKAEKQPADSEPKPKKATPPPLPKSPLKRELKPLKPLSEPPKPKPTAPPSEPPPPKPRAAAPPPKAATPPRPETPLPQFISQFKGAEWFEKYFPNGNENNVPKPWTVDNFAIMVSKLLRIAEYIHKISVADALIMMQTQEDFTEPTAHQITKTLSAVLNDHKEPPTCMDDKQKSFIVSSLRLLNNLNIRDKEFITELMVQFLDGDKEVRTTVVEIFQSNSLQDPHKFLQKELDSWDIWNVEEDDRKADLRKMCHQWLDRWMTSYKMHLNDTIDKMKKGQNVHGKMSRGQMQRRSSVQSKSILKRDSIAEEEGGADFVPKAPGGPRSITVTFDKPPDSALVESATYIDAINYFCDMMMSKEMDASRRGTKKLAGVKEGQENVVQAKNTVLVLPKLPHKPALVRLGETHTSTCRPHRETNLHIDYRMPALTYRGKQPEPGQLSGFTPSINLPMKPVYLNPFPSVVDQYDTRFQEPILITLKSAQKYFIHNQSFIPQEPPVAPAH